MGRMIKGFVSKTARFSGVKLAFCLSAVATGLTVGAADGIWQVSGGNLNWMYRPNWQYDGIAGEGGVANFVASPDGMNVDAAVSLSGLFFEDSRACALNGSGPISFVAPLSWIQCNRYRVVVNTPLQGSGDNEVVKGGAGPFYLSVKPTNLARFGLTGGDLISNGAADTTLSAVDFHPMSGSLNYAPSTAGSMTIQKLIYGPGRTFVKVDDANGAATVALGDLQRDNGALVVYPMSGLSALGETEKVTIAKEPTLSNGMMAASVVAFDSTKTKGGDSQMFFTTYDATKGIVPAADPVAWDATADQSDKIVKIAAATSVAADKRVHALYVDSTTTDLTLGAKLAVGNGSDPAGVIINNVGSGAFTLNLKKGAETCALDFGTAPGILWCGQAQGKSAAINVNAPIRSTHGVMFAGALSPAANSQVVYNLKVPAEWTGPTVVCGARVGLPNAAALPEGDVYVTGYDSIAQGNIRVVNSMTFSDRYRFHLSGTGYCAGNYGRSAIHIGGSSPTIEIQGETEIRDKVAFWQDDAGDTLLFSGPVTGTGSIEQGQGILRLSAVNTFAGNLQVKAGVVEVTGKGTLGAGRVTGAGTLKFLNCADLLVTNNIAFTGAVEFRGGHVILDGRQSFAKTTFSGGVVVEYGPYVDLGTVTTDGTATFKSLTGSTSPAMAKVGGTTDVTISGQRFEDVNIVKTGSNTVTIPIETVSGGKLTITEGTVMLSGDVFSTGLVSYWMDASQTSTLTATDNKVSVWTSANGNGVTFTNKYPSPVTMGETQNGLNVLRFVNDGSHYGRFDSTSEVSQRTVYIVAAPEKPDWWDSARDPYLSIWGKMGIEVGLRYQGYSNGWGTLRFANLFCRNGVQGAATCALDGQWQILGMVNESNDDYVKFTPAIGSYETWEHRNFNGKIAEVIAFTRALNQTERQQVENYLAEKWGLKNTVWHEGVDTFGAAFSNDVMTASTKLEILMDSTLDLNGVNQTVASLSGHGRIINSSANPVKLTVTGDCVFSGTVGAGVELVKTGESDGSFKGTVDGAVTVASGELNMAVAAPEPPTDGLLFWLDASTADVLPKDDAAAEDAIVTNANGQIARWYCRAKDRCGVKSFKSLYAAPTYTANGFNGIGPSAYFNGDKNGLVAETACSPKTVAVMYWASGKPGAFNYLWGYEGGGDSGVRLNASSMKMEFNYCFGGDSSFSGRGDFIYKNGARVDLAGVDEPGVYPFGCLIFTRGDWHKGNQWVGRKPVIGDYVWWNGNAYFHVGEVIAYDRVLSDAECKAVSKYLMDKWTGESLPQPQGGFGANATLTVSNGATADLSAMEDVSVGTIASDATGGTIVGDVTANAFVYDAQNASSVLPLVVNGSVSFNEGATASFTDYADLPRANWEVLKATNGAEGTLTTESPLLHFCLNYGNGRWWLGPRGFSVFVR